MQQIKMPRLTILYVISAMTVVLLHAWLCYPAAISRGHPPLPPFDLAAIFLAPLGMLIPPLFDDAYNDYTIRFRRSAIIATAFGFIWAIVETNLGSSRPHIGHLAGVVGIFQHDGLMVLLLTVSYLVPAWVFFMSLDGVAIGLWSCVREFPRESDGDAEKTASSAKSKNLDQ